MQDDILSDFLCRVINENFPDLDDAIVNALPEKDERYATLIAQEQELKERFPGINSWLEDEGPLTLSAEEHAALGEYIGITAEMEGIERLEIYYAGHNNCIAYLKKAGVI